jgi:hypothetical protein
MLKKTGNGRRKKFTFGECYEVLRRGTDRESLDVNVWILDRSAIKWVHWRERMVEDPERYRFTNEADAASALVQSIGGKA